MSAIIGVVLAIALVSGTWIAVDSTAKYGLEKHIGKEKFDFTGSTYKNISYSNAMADISKVREVKRVEVVAEVCSSSLGHKGRTENWVNIIGVRNEFSEVMDKFNLKGELKIDFPSCSITSYLAKSLNVSLGDIISFKNFIEWQESEWNETLNATVTKYYSKTIWVNLTVESILELKKYAGLIEIEKLEKNMVFINIANASEVRNLLKSGFPKDIKYPPGEYYKYDYGDGIGYKFYIWIDRENVINIADAEVTKKRLDKIRKNIEYQSSAYGISIQSVLEYAISNYESSLMWAKTMFAVFSLPVMGMGAYLGLLGVNLGLDTRRQEVGLLKARGGSNFQIFSLLILETIILGIIAGVLGLVLGLAVSRIIMLLLPESQPMALFYSFSITLTTIVLAIIFALVILLLPSYRTLKRFSKIELMEALQTYSKEEAKVKYNPKWDIVFISVGAFVFCTNVFLRPEELRMDFFTMCIVGIALSISSILLPFTPIFLVFGITRLLTRATHKTYEYVARALKFFTKELYGMVIKNIVRNPKRVAMVCTMIALVLTFGVFFTTVKSTMEHNSERMLKNEIGSDIKVRGYFNTSFSNDIELGKIDGVKEYCIAIPYLPYKLERIETKTTTIDKYPMFSERIVVFNSSTYYKVAYLDEYNFVEGGINDIKNLEDCIVINKRASVETDLHRGDKYRVEINNTIYQFKIKAVVKALPGLESNPYTRVVFIDLEYLKSKMNFTYEKVDIIFFIKVAPGYKSKEVGRNIRENYDVDVEVYDERLGETRSDASINFMNIQYGFILFIATIGLGLIMYTSVLERENEIGNIIARGANLRQIRILYLSEAITIIIIGSIIGLAVGILTAYVFIRLMTSFIQTDIPIVFDYSIFIVILATIASLLLVSYIIAYRASKLELSKILRFRGG
ncbi:MAG: FtsX-like permease family protein [Candidatus Thermoplasmatota archaeon]